MTFFAEIVDYDIINTEFLDTYLKVRDALRTVEGLEDQVSRAVRDCMNRTDWLTEKDGTVKVLKAMYGAFAGYLRSHGKKCMWTVGKSVRSPGGASVTVPCSFEIVE